MKTVELYARVRRAVLVEGMSRRGGGGCCGLLPLAAATEVRLVVYDLES